MKFPLPYKAGGWGGEMVGWAWGRFGRDEISYSIQGGWAWGRFGRGSPLKMRESRQNITSPILLLGD